MTEAIAEDDDLLACPSRDTINRIIGDASIPAKQADVIALVITLTRRIGGDAEQAGRRAAELWTQVHLAEPLGRPISDLDPYALEVHHGIAMRGIEGLTEYVERDHDVELQQIIHLASEGRSRMVMLVGSSSCGKTRACYEAIQHLPDDWLLWHPIEPDRPQAALAGLAKVGPKTVIWLNEAHRYLLHDQFGEPIASGLRALLSDMTRAPVLILGTIWPGPGYFDDLLYSPKPGKVDPYSQARVLIADRVLHVPSAFTPHEVAKLKRSADPRLAAAARSAQDGMVT
ncbi:hypothetical protein ACIGDI_39565 [Streptomyces sp. NPDC085900]|uniref:hypothetical protein n=1 Tax=Streptomyces sp. NPDC085900 TaxID=3365737 RepID=UPI0037D80FBF